MASGRLFQVRGPEMANDLSLNEVCVRGTWSFPLSADLIPGRRLTLYPNAPPVSNVAVCQITLAPVNIIIIISFDSNTVTLPLSCTVSDM